jgi:hypothetical protein
MLHAAGPEKFSIVIYYVPVKQFLGVQIVRREGGERGEPSLWALAKWTKRALALDRAPVMISPVQRAGTSY